MAAAIKRQMGLEVDLVEGSGGILELRAKGNLVFTNKGEDAEPYPGDDKLVLRLQDLKYLALRSGMQEPKGSTDDGRASSCTIDPPPIVKAPIPELRTDIDRLSFACNCAPMAGPEGCTCRN